MTNRDMACALKQYRLHCRPTATRLSAAAASITLLFYLAMFAAVPMALAEAENTDELDILISAQQLENSVNRALASNQSELKNLETQLQQLESLQVAVRSEIEAYESQNTVHGQLLLSTQFQIQDLEKALAENRLISRVLAERIDKFQKRHDTMAPLIQQSNARIDISQHQIANIRASQLGDEERQKLESANRELIKVLGAKKDLGARYLKISEVLLRGMKVAFEEKVAIAQKLTTLLVSSKKASLFERLSPYREFSGHYFSDMFRTLGDRLGAVVNPAAWKAHWGMIRMGGLGRWVVFLAAFTLVIFVQRRFRVYMKRTEKKIEGAGWYYRRLGFVMLRRSLFLIVMTVFFGIYNLLHGSLFMIGLGPLLFKLFLIMLVTRWGLIYIKQGYSGPPKEVRSFVSRFGRRFFHVFRATGILLVLLAWSVGKDTSLIWTLRDILSVALLVVAVVFWRRLKFAVAEGLRDGQAAPDAKSTALLRALSFIVLGGTLLLNLAGYGNLAAHWITAWIETTMLGFWGWISLNAIREWHRDYQAEDQTMGVSESVDGAHLWRWSMIKLARALWLFLLAGGILLAWDNAGYLWGKLGHIVGVTFTIGKVNLSIKGILMAVVIIYFTQLFVVIGRSLLSLHILEKRSLERGLKDSILTVTSYLGWGFGLLLALATIGVDATSLAVVFGALSVGIGFGLQNIFNNFISGLILLFERPIQVGDIVEVGTLMAEVKKINVRATVVQTFDNASVIIPNADFISQQVTNWSFKDKRMRRNIEVGVAYGSDIELVEKTLIEIAHERKRVLKFPKPDVIFIDHAASTLLFRLRIWVHIDNYWVVPSLIRFEIDRRFNELDIEIAFPQRDLHIRSYPEEFKLPVPAPEKKMMPASPREQIEPTGKSE